MVLRLAVNGALAAGLSRGFYRSDSKRAMFTTKYEWGIFGWPLIHSFGYAEYHQGQTYGAAVVGERRISRRC
jgi:hypothetical protein